MEEERGEGDSVGGVEVRGLGGLVVCCAVLIEVVL